MTAPATLNHRRLLAPREDRSALVEPPLADVAGLAEANRRILDRVAYEFCGRRFAEIAQTARAELFETARMWTAAYRNVPAPPERQSPIFLAGHQPQMIHPGVWFKNFVLAELARRHGATAVNLAVDSDAVTEVSLRVPTGSIAEPTAEPVFFDRPDPKVPFEERRIEDRGLFAQFGQRAMEQIAPLVADPLMAQYWRLVCNRSRHTDNLGNCLAQARHQLEGQWGLDTLEVPQSRVCSGEAFAWFAVDLLGRLPEFRAIHNEAIRQYRQMNRIRSTSHPAPELAADATWFEAPFWVWTVAEPRRRRLFARQTRDEILLSDRQSWQTSLPIGRDGNADRAVARFLDLQRGDVRIRSRAMITTLWARLALGDLFVHGIGGAKYDQVTDLLMKRFYGIDPPSFLVVSATLHLPISRDRATEDDARAIAKDLREVDYHPERFLAGLAADADALIATKWHWIETPQDAAGAKERCQAIRAANAALQPWLVERRGRLLEDQGQILRRLKAERVLAWREYAFCLYPESTLREFYSGLLHKLI